MTDVMTVEQRSRVMARNSGTGTSPERYVGALLRAGGLRFDQHESSLPGRPDFVFAKSRVAVFVDGDFWHGWRFPVWRHRLAPFWLEKIAKNRTRDQRNFRTLRRDGWRVLRIWEHEVELDVVGCVTRIASATGMRFDRDAAEACYSGMPRLKRRKRLPKP